MPNQGKPQANTVVEASAVNGNGGAEAPIVGPLNRIMSVRNAKEFVRAYSEASGGAKTAIGASPVFAVALRKLYATSGTELIHPKLRDAALATTGSLGTTTFKSLAIEIAAALSITLP